jgi:3-oxoacyl-[acyl-carrier-protein] synthase-3
MTNNLKPRIIGTGYSVPKKTRGNDDPKFNWIKENIPDYQNLFDGYDTRHVLSYGESLMTIMVPAAQNAMKMAGITADKVDILLGTGSIGDYRMPNQLCELHLELELPERAWVLPIDNDYSNFNSALMIADSLLRAGRAQNILICIGGNWSTNVDYHTAQSISAGDGAGAAVVSMSDDITKWSYVDQCTISETKYFGSMFTSRVEIDLNQPYGYGFGAVPLTYTPNFFQITKTGLAGFKSFGMDKAADAVTGLLQAKGLTGADITFVPHQTSSTLIDHWNTIVEPAQCFTTLPLFANITVATHVLNLAYGEESNSFIKNKLVFLALGPEMHANAILLERGE